MHIDLSLIPKNVPAAVVIPNKEFAKAFLDEMKVHYPERVSNWNRATYYHDICYIPHFESHWGMTTWSVSQAKAAGYPIVWWNEISQLEELDTGVSEYSISMLLE